MRAICLHGMLFWIRTLRAHVVDAVDLGLSSYILPLWATRIATLRHRCGHLLRRRVPKLPPGLLIEPGFNYGVLYQLVWVYLCQC